MTPIIKVAFHNTVQMRIYPEHHRMLWTTCIDSYKSFVQRILIPHCILFVNSVAETVQFFVAQRPISDDVELYYANISNYDSSFICMGNTLHYKSSVNCDELAELFWNSTFTLNARARRCGFGNFGNLAWRRLDHFLTAYNYPSFEKWISTV